MSDTDNAAEENWDFEAQRADTADTLDHMAKEESLPIGTGARVNLDVFLVPGEGADQEALERALAMFGYGGELTEDEEDGSVSFVVTAEDTEMSLEGIWLHEERITKVGLARGYTPDGWGFWEP